MESSETLQNQPSETKVPASKSRRRNSKKTGGWNVAIYLLTHYPWLLFIGFLGIFAGSSVVALRSLTHVEKLTNLEPEPIKVKVVKANTTTSEDSNPIPLWMVGAIVLSCASGCLILFRWLNHRVPKQQKTRKNSQRHHKRSEQRHYQKLNLPPVKNPPSVVPPFAQKHQFKIQPKKKPTVTILPPDRKLQQNQNQESLADVLDIRKQSSLSAILRKQ
ncbi:MAG: hypothetical protein QNJ47_15890 [Nostocaceae cyanobacterium]|nr:hypothetical protein [Nostocaceae cyanobacterium]